MRYSDLFPKLELLAWEASNMLCQFSEKAKLQVEVKSDLSPVSEADIAVDQFFQRSLPKLLDIPVISEEESLPPPEARAKWQDFWLVDPLDGTTNFIQGDDEFSLIISLLINRKPVLGMIAVPKRQVIYEAAKGEGAWKISRETRIRLPLPHDGKNRIAVNKYSSDAGKRRLKELCSKLRLSTDLAHPVGSALKSALAAEGQFDIVAVCDRLFLWDLAGVECLLSETGFELVQFPEESPVVYDPSGSMERAGFLAKKPR